MSKSNSITRSDIYQVVKSILNPFRPYHDKQARQMLKWNLIPC